MSIKYTLLIFLVNSMICCVVIYKLIDYLRRYKELAKKIETLDATLYLERYCDRVFKSPMRRMALFEEILHPEDIHPTLKTHLDKEFALTRASMFSAIQWLLSEIVFVSVLNCLFA